jgi:hypothetical protein
MNYGCPSLKYAEDSNLLKIAVPAEQGSPNYCHFPRHTPVHKLHAAFPSTTDLWLFNRIMQATSRCHIKSWKWKCLQYWTRTWWQSRLQLFKWQLLKIRLNLLYKAYTASGLVYIVQYRNWDSAVDTATGHGVQVFCPCHPDQLWAHPVYPRSIGALSWRGWSDWGMKLTTPLCLLPRSRICGSITFTPPIHLHGVMLN